MDAGYIDDGFFPPLEGGSWRPREYPHVKKYVEYEPRGRKTSRESNSQTFARIDNYQIELVTATVHEVDHPSSAVDDISSPYDNRRFSTTISDSAMPMESDVVYKTLDTGVMYYNDNTRSKQKRPSVKQFARNVFSKVTKKKKDKRSQPDHSIHVNVSSLPEPSNDVMKEKRRIDMDSTYDGYGYDDINSTIKVNPIPEIATVLKAELNEERKSMRGKPKTLFGARLNERLYERELSKSDKNLNKLSVHKRAAHYASDSKLNNKKSSVFGKLSWSRSKSVSELSSKKRSDGEKNLNGKSSLSKRIRDRSKSWTALKFGSLSSSKKKFASDSRLSRSKLSWSRHKRAPETAEEREDRERNEKLLKEEIEAIRHGPMSQLNFKELFPDPIPPRKQRQKIFDRVDLFYAPNNTTTNTTAL